VNGTTDVVVAETNAAMQESNKRKQKSKKIPPANNMVPANAAIVETVDVSLDLDEEASIISGSSKGSKLGDMSKEQLLSYLTTRKDMSRAELLALALSTEVSSNSTNDQQVGMQVGMLNQHGGFPNQQQQMVHPNQQQPILFPNQQQPILFPSQQQPIGFSNQHQIGVPNQQQIGFQLGGGFANQQHYFPAQPMVTNTPMPQQGYSVTPNPMTSNAQQFWTPAMPNNGFQNGFQNGFSTQNVPLYMTPQQPMGGMMMHPVQPQQLMFQQQQPSQPPSMMYLGNPQAQQAQHPQMQVTRQQIQQVLYQGPQGGMSGVPSIMHSNSFGNGSIGHSGSFG
jgi:hypothetical protein